MSYPTYSDLELEIQELEEENRSLKNELMEDMKTESKLNEEIRNLKSENADLKSELSKFSEAYKKYRDYEKEELAESCYDLARENKKLKENIAWYEKEEDRLTKEISSYANKNYILYRNCEDLNNENKFLRKGNRKLKEKIGELEKEIEELNKMMLFETELEK